jgi:hypothetical protein
MESRVQIRRHWAWPKYLKKQINSRKNQNLYVSREESTTNNEFSQLLKLVNEDTSLGIVREHNVESVGPHMGNLIIFSTVHLLVRPRLLAFFSRKECKIFI